jgi:LysM repeat protein
LVFRLVGPIHTQPSTKPCPEGSSDYYIKSGDTCWQITKTYGCTLDRMLDVNSGLNCDVLRVGEKICVPYPDK